MAASVKRVEYYYALIKDTPGEASRFLTAIAGHKVNLLAFSAVPMGPERTQLQLFPESAELLARAAERTGTVIEGPHRAFMVQGDDELGALASVHLKVGDAGVNVFASSGVTDGRGGFGYVIYVRPDDYERAASALGL